MMLASNAFETEYGQPLMLTKEQQAIVASQARSVILAALAGTGKTTTLACCAVQALRHNPQSRILVLAYSKAGVQAFQHRLHMLLRATPPHIHVTTMERWSARALRRRDPQVRFVTDPLELRQHAQQALAHLQEQQAWHPGEHLDLPPDVDMQALDAFQRAAKKSLLMDRMQEEGLSLREFCEQYALDFATAQLFMACERLRIDHCGDTAFYAEGDCTYALARECLEGMALDVPAYDLVLFDEMHDLDLAALTVLRSMLGGSQARFLGAGDFNQHIEAQAWSVFQDKLHQLADFLPHLTHTLPLTQSRRFGPAIAQAVNAWFDVGMQAPSNRRSSVIRASYQDDAQCIAQVLQAHNSLLAVAPGTQARIPLTVILRHAYEALPLEWAIHQSGKTASLHGIAPFYLQRDIALLLGLLYAHGLQAPDWKSSPCILSPAILAAFIDGALYFGKGQIHSTQDATDLPTLAAQMHQHPQGIWRFLIGNQHLQGGQRNLAAFGQFLELPLRLQADAHALLTQADIAGLFTSTPLPSDDQAQLGARVQTFIRTTQGLSVREVLQRVADIALRHDKVLRNGQNFDFQLISIEHAKGLEFEYVALPFLEPGRFPAPAPHATAFLERNRLYVAMTRAKQKLWLLEHAQRPVPGFAS